MVEPETRPGPGRDERSSSMEHRDCVVIAGALLMVTVFKFATDRTGSRAVTTATVTLPAPQAGASGPWGSVAGNLPVVAAALAEDELQVE
jgi:hypothetical protein